jgi:hypothetical protein
VGSITIARIATNFAQKKDVTCDGDERTHFIFSGKDFHGRFY